MNVDPTILAALKEIAQATQGSLAVAQCHIQLAKQRVVTGGDRILNDHVDTALVFTDSAATVISTINEMVQRVEHQMQHAVELRQAG